MNLDVVVLSFYLMTYYRIVAVVGGVSVVRGRGGGRGGGENA